MTSHLAAGHLVLLHALGEEGGGVLGLDAGGHDHGAALSPVHGGRHAAPLQRNVRVRCNIKTFITLDKTAESCLCKRFGNSIKYTL